MRACVLPHKPLYAIVAGLEGMIRDQVLINPLGAKIVIEFCMNDLGKGLTLAGPASIR